ncbi:hypothetical protein INT80_01555 [Gallibacterium anatis]|uniref:Uncharacterized protein n=1 Tax=Gallibacterium anatis TaxID=750 RepID=A0A930US10_9PAST|nr:hypothetical protein [Gallibacterium anatis]
MKQQGLVSKQPRKRWRSGTSEKASTLFNNVLNRQFSPLQRQRCYVVILLILKCRGMALFSDSDEFSTTSSRGLAIAETA